MKHVTSLTFKFINFGSELEINIDDNNQAQCPKCEKKFKQLMQHLNKSKVCRANIDLDNFKIEYESFRNKRKVNACRQRKLETNLEETHKNEAEKQRLIRERKLHIDAKGTRRNEAQKKRQERERKRKLIDKTEETHRVEAKRKRIERTNLKIGVTQTDRLRKFKRAVLFGPIFVCSCCHVKHFESNVTLLDDNLKFKLLEKYPECYTECIRDLEKVLINEDIKYYLC